MKNIAVIMSVYISDDLNDFKLSVNSILNQSLRCDVYIYRDGIVNDNVDDYLNYLSELENVFIIKSDINNGLAHALNSLIDIIAKEKYEYIARMDSDDISDLNRIQIQSDFLSSNIDVDVVGSFCREFGSSFALNTKKLPTKHNDLIKFSITRCPFIHPTVMFRNSIFMRGFRYPVNTHYTEDMALWFILLENGYKFSNIPEILLEYRLSEETASRRRGLNKAYSEIKLRFRYMKKLNHFSFSNTFFILSRLVFHFMPTSFLKLAYKFLR